MVPPGFLEMQDDMSFDPGKRVGHLLIKGTRIYCSGGVVYANQSPQGNL